jgi:hypothetical protein
MKRILIGLLALVLLVLAALIIVPVIFKDDIVKLVKDEANKNLNARVEFGDFSMSLFTHFPDFTFSIEDLSVVGISEFEGDTLVSIGELSLSVDLMSVIRRENILVKAIRIDELNALTKVLEDGKVNWDIVKKSEEEEVPETEAGADTVVAAPFSVSLEEFLIVDSDIVYSDAQAGLYAELKELDFSLAGDFTQDFTTLETKTTVSAVTFEMDTVRYLNRVELEFNADIDADLANAKYQLKNNEFRLNQLFLEWDGHVAMPGDDIELDIKFNARETEFKNILSLIPAVYAKDFEDIRTTGKLALDGYARGMYSEDLYPAFGVKLVVENATLQYPDLPESASNINVNLSVNNPGGDLDNTLVNMSRFHVEIAGNPIDVRLVMKTPVSDPDIHCQVTGKLDLNKLGNVIPREEGEDLSGQISSNITLIGKLSAIETERYEEFRAVGGLTIKGMNYVSADFPQGMTIEEADLQFSPQYVKLTAFRCKTGESDIAVTGVIENFIPYAMSDGAVLKGKGELKSRLINLNELMKNGEEEGVSAKEDTVTTSVVEIPANVDFRVTSALDRVLYEEITISNVRGVLKVKDRTLTMENLSMDLMGGKTTINGSYTTKDVKRPAVNMDLAISNWDIPLAFRTFNTVQILAPIAENCSFFRVAARRLIVSEFLMTVCFVSRPPDPVSDV